jgi:sirohydrochlorin cobaltochelatase
MTTIGEGGGGTDPAEARGDIPEKPALLLAAFGTGRPEAISDLMNIRRRAAASFPGHEIVLAFTSNRLRRLWNKRSGDRDFRRTHPDLPEKIYRIPGVLAALAAIQAEGARPILVQSLHIADGEEYRDLANLVNALGNHRTCDPARNPFPWLGMGPPALGRGDGSPSSLARAALALEPLGRRARDSGAVLVLGAHGNARLAGGVYGGLAALMRQTLDWPVHIGTIEAPPRIGDLVRAIKKSAPAGKILLAPLLVTAGEHAVNDLAGGDASWAAAFRSGGFKVETHLSGLGANDSWADIYVESLRTLAAEVPESLPAPSSSR